MSTADKNLRVLIVDDNRDGADALGLLAEAFGNQVHVAYGGTQALDVATTFRPDLMLIDLAMPEMDGCVLGKRLRQIPTFSHTRLIAITGHADEGHRNLARKAGFDAVLAKPVALNEIIAVLADLAVVSAGGPSRLPENPVTERRLPIGVARKIRNQRPSKSLTQAESEAAISAGIARFHAEYLGWSAEQIRTSFINDMLLVRITGALTLAERQLGKSESPEKGRDLIKQTRKQLLELARPMLDSLVQEIAGVEVLSMHHDISTVTGEEVVIFLLANEPRYQ